MRTRDERIKTYEAMKNYGGGFLSALAEAYIRADEKNQEKIERGWVKEIAHAENIQGVFPKKSGEAVMK